MTCLFCRIASGELPARRLYEDDLCIAFEDIHPQAPVHLLVTPRMHLPSTAHTDATHIPLLGSLIAVAAQIARQQNLEAGYRLVLNTGEDGGQTVDHLHLHLLGGRSMEWPPG